MQPGLRMIYHRQMGVAGLTPIRDLTELGDSREE